MVLDLMTRIVISCFLLAYNSGLKLLWAATFQILWVLLFRLRLTMRCFVRSAMERCKEW